MTDEETTMGQLKSFCQSYFSDKRDRFSVEIKTHNTAMYDKSQKSGKDLLAFILNSVHSPNIFVLFQCNRLFYGTEGVINPYGVILQTSYPNDRYDARRMLLFDGQPYLHPYLEKDPSWITFHKYFYNYWYANKEQRINMPTQRAYSLSRLTKLSVHSFFSYNLEPIKLPIQRFDVFINSSLIDSMEDSQKQKIMEILQANLNKQQIQKVQIFRSDRFTVETLPLIKKSLEMAFTEHQNNIVFFDDTLSFTVQSNSSGVIKDSNIIIKEVEERNNWKRFFEGSSISSNSNLEFKGFSTGLINLKYAEKFMDFNSEDHNLRNFTYVKGFNAGDLLHILHLRYSSAYMKRNPSTFNSPDKKK